MQARRHAPSVRQHAKLVREEASLTLEPLLDRWRDNPHPAWRAEIVGQVARPRMPATKDAFQTWWMDNATTDDPELIGCLAATLCTKLPGDPKDRGFDEAFVLRRHAALLERIAALRALPRDPRIADALLDAFGRNHLSTCAPQGIAALYGPLLKGLEATEDLVVAEALHALAVSPPWSPHSTRSWCQAESRAVAGRMKPRPWTPVPGLVATTAPHAEGLLNQLRDAPADQGLRAVYADALSAEEDPRGQFISLQLAGADGEADKLLRKHRKQWLGDLLSRTLVNVEFVDGFLHSADLADNTNASAADWQRAAVDPRLATLRRLRRGRQGNQVHHLMFLDSPACRALEDVAIRTRHELAAVLNGPLAERLTHLEGSFGLRATEWSALRDRCPNLKQLSLKTTEKRRASDERALARSGLAPRLTKVVWTT